mmetsp:Transcript_47455/g.113000  ORF Transcript_47455/g.113000 Transcript_47455/m.113000 type:complete len:421 (-) Transcript_47455:62-1324(-)
MAQVSKIGRGCSYALAMGISGWLVVSAGVMYPSLASNAHIPSTGSISGLIFLTRAGAMVLASFLGPSMFSGFEDDLKLAAVLLLASALFLATTFVTELLALHLWFAAAGFAYAATDVGTQILTRRKFGEGADPWLAFNLVVFSVFCVAASTLYFLPGLWLQGLVSAILPAGVALCLVAVRLLSVCEPDRLEEKEEKAQKNPSPSLLGWEFKWEGLEIDWLLMVVIFWATAGQVAIGMYTYVYVAETGQVSEEEAGWLMFAFWCTIALSRLVIFFQQVLGDRSSSASSITLIRAVGVCLALGSAFSLVWALGPRDSPWSMRVGLLGYAIFFGPIYSCAFILSNRLGARTDQTAAMGVLGLNLGAGFGPFIYAAMSEVAGPASLPSVVFGCLSVFPGLAMLGVWHYASKDGVIPGDYHTVKQ